MTVDNNIRTTDKKNKYNNKLASSTLPGELPNKYLSVIQPDKNSILKRIILFFSFKWITKKSNLPPNELVQKSHFETEILSCYDIINKLSKKCENDRKRIAEITAEITANPKNIFNLQHEIQNIMLEIKKNENAIKTQKRYIKMIS